MASQSEPVLHGYWRSTASYRVRIALNLKGIAYRDAGHDLRRGAQRAADYLAINPQGLVPALAMDGAVLTQSLAICAYLDEMHPEPPLLPAEPLARAKVRAFALAIACDIHPVQNLGVLKRLKALGIDQAGIDGWAASVIADGLAACERLLAGQAGPYCFGPAVTLADIVLVPQLVNARRFGAAVPARLAAIEVACLELDAFRRAAPEAQADAEA